MSKRAEYGKRTAVADEKDIPDGPYCHAGTLCPHWRDLGVIILHRDELAAKTIAELYPEKPSVGRACDLAGECEDECWSSTFTSCKMRRIRCEYLDYTDESEETLLWDKVKICEVNEE